MTTAITSSLKKQEAVWDMLEFDITILVLILGLIFHSISIRYPIVTNKQSRYRPNFKKHREFSQKATLN